MTIQETNIETTYQSGDSKTVGMTIVVDGKREYYCSYHAAGDSFSVYRKTTRPGLRFGKHFHNGNYRLNFSHIRGCYKQDGAILEEVLTKLKGAA